VFNQADRYGRPTAKHELDALQSIGQPLQLGCLRSY
jgi:hypothetical protein